MEDPAKANEEVLTRDVIEAGKRVTIFVHPIDEGLWELSIRGKNDQFTTWTDWFSSPQEAMDAGMSAISKEGILEFYSCPDFEYNL